MDREINTNFLNYSFDFNKSEKSKFYKNIESLNYFSEKLTEHTNLLDEIKKQKLDTKKVIDRIKIEKIEDLFYKKTIYYRNKWENLFIMVDNIELYESINNTKKIFTMKLKKGIVNYNPDYYDTILWESISSEKTEYYIDDISQEVLISVDYNINWEDDYTFFWTVSFMTDIDLKIKKNHLYFIISSFFEKYSWNQSLEMDFEYAYSTDNLANLITNTDKLLWLKYKELPNGMTKRVFNENYPESTKEKDYYAEVSLSKSILWNFLWKTESLKDFLKSISDLNSLRIKTTSWLIKEEKLRHNAPFTFVVDSKFNFVDPTQKNNYRKLVIDKILKVIKFNPN